MRLSALLRLVVVNVVVVLFLLLALEGAVRLALPQITPLGTDSRLVADSLFADAPGPRPGAVGTSNGATFRADDDGFWVYASAAPATAPAWLFLGDSVTMGIGVVPDSTFAGRLAARQDTARVRNPSLVGYSSRDYRKVLETVVRRDSVSRVTVFWCLNDVYAGVPGLGDPDRALRRLGSGVLAFVRRHFHTYQWLKALFFDRPRTYYEHDRRLYEQPAFAAALDAAVEDLAHLHAVAAARGVAFDVVLLPYEYQLRAATSGEAADVFLPQRRLAGRLSARGVPVRDAAPYLLAGAGDPSALYLYGDGIHLSAAGHRLVADLVADLAGE